MKPKKLQNVAHDNKSEAVEASFFLRKKGRSNFMGMFKKAFKAVAKPVKSAVKSTIKNAVPITAGVLTGGASLTYLKPSGGLFDKAYGAIGMGQPGSIEEAATQYAQEKITNEASRVVNRAIQPKQNTSSRRINSQSVSNGKPIGQSISETFESVTNAVGGKKNSTMIVVGVVVLIIGLLLFKRSGK